MFLWKQRCFFPLSQWPGSSDTRNPWGNHRLQPSLSIHSQSPELTWKCFHGMARGNWYLEREVYNFATLKLVWSFWRRMYYSWGYWVGEDKDRNAVSWRPSDGKRGRVLPSIFQKSQHWHCYEFLLWFESQHLITWKLLVAAQVAAKAFQASECPAITCDPWQFLDISMEVWK